MEAHALVGISDAHATCWGMPPEVAHVVIGVVLFLFPIVAALLVALLVRASRNIRELRADVALVKPLALRSNGLWDETLYGPQGADLRARLIVRQGAPVILPDRRG